MDRTIFFNQVRAHPFAGSLDQSQVDGLNTILGEWDKRYPQGDARWLAYILATVFHETDREIKPVREIGHGAGKQYGIADLTTGKAYYGRGYVQLTWKANYVKLAPLAGADLVGDPDLALRPDIAATVMFVGMERGLFTGKKLADFFNAQTSDWTNARTIINGHDRAADIAGYAQHFYAAIKAAIEAPRADTAGPAEKENPMDLKSIFSPHLAAVPDVPTTGEGLAAALSQLHEKVEGLGQQIKGAGAGVPGVGALLPAGGGVSTILMHAGGVLVKQYNVPALVAGYVRSADVGKYVAPMIGSLAGALPSSGIMGAAFGALRGALQNPGLADLINNEVQKIPVEQVLNDGINHVLARLSQPPTLDLQVNKPAA